MNQSRIISSLLIALMGCGIGGAEVPAGYYDSCKGLSGQALLTALHRTITSHTNVGYDGLYELYKKSDIRPEDNTIWDMYSTKHWAPGSTCGNYSGVGSCYNREHSFPKSWFGGKVAPMYSDAYHLYPTDGQVNGYRGNYPYGECAGGKTWSNGNIKALGRLGTSTYPGYSGTVFEPDDQYKGDFARSYFYMAACYNDRIASWSSPMLAGNAYPAFESWAGEMLLKWHRNDAVSDKELNRNEAVAEAQHNRNPFIDHPELVEHIWGDKKGQAWYPADDNKAAINAPANGSTVDMGIVASGHTATVTVRLKTSGMTSNVTASAAGTGFSVSPTVISAAGANAGTNLTVSFAASTAGNISGTLTVSGSDNQSAKVYLQARCVSGLPLYPAEEVTEHSFVVRWENIDGADALYSVDVRRDGRSINGYPCNVAASKLRHEVTGLEAAATYTFSVSGPTLRSEELSVTMAEPTPMIRFLYDDTLDFTAIAGQPSEVAEVMIDVDNIAEDIEITVDEPFEVSTDRSSWSRSVTLTPDEDRFYLRLNSDEPGHFSTAVEARAGSYFTDEVIVEGVVSTSYFCETFDMPSDLNSYNGGEYEGTAATWNVTEGNVWEADNGFNGGPSMRFRNSGVLEMAADKDGGMGKISFDLRKWDNKADGEATVVAEYSTDGGNTWIEAGSATSAEPVFTTHTFTVNVKGKARLRLRQTAGKRYNLDNVTITDYSGASASNGLEYHAWDAYCRDGRLVIESTGDDQLCMFGIDGVIRFEGVVTGSKEFTLAPGLYIVASDSFSRRVVVK